MDPDKTASRSSLIRFIVFVSMIKYSGVHLNTANIVAILSGQKNIDKIVARTIGPVKQFFFGVKLRLFTYASV